MTEKLEAAKRQKTLPKEGAWIQEMMTEMARQRVNGLIAYLNAIERPITNKKPGAPGPA